MNPIVAVVFTFFVAVNAGGLAPVPALQSVQYSTGYSHLAGPAIQYGSIAHSAPLQYSTLAHAAPAISYAPQAIKLAAPIQQVKYAAAPVQQVTVPVSFQYSTSIQHAGNQVAYAAAPKVALAAHSPIYQSPLGLNLAGPAISYSAQKLVSPALSYAAQPALSYATSKVAYASAPAISYGPALSVQKAVPAFAQAVGAY